MLDIESTTTVLANLAAFLGIPLAIAILIIDRQRAQIERERTTYLSLQQDYSDFLKLCLDHPSIGPYPDVSEEKTRSLILFELVISMLECAHFLYAQGHRSEFVSRQWTGWDQYAQYWMSRSDFREAWSKHLGSQFDGDFVQYMKSLHQAACSGGVLIDIAT